MATESLSRVIKHLVITNAVYSKERDAWVISVPTLQRVFETSTHVPLPEHSSLYEVLDAGTRLGLWLVDRDDTIGADVIVIL